jgi:hypothetical protein
MNQSIIKDISYFFSAKFTAKEVMAQAWFAAKTIAKENNISSKSIFSLCLKAAWKQVVVKVCVESGFKSRQLLAKNKFTFNAESKLWIREMSRNEARDVITHALMRITLEAKITIKFS